MLKKVLCLSGLLLGGVNVFADTANKVIQLDNSEQTITITLPANATTGYSWFVKCYNHNLLTLMDYHYQSSKTKAAGVGGNSIFTFAVNPSFFDGPQVSKITFIYMKPWVGPDQTNNSETVWVVSQAAASNPNIPNWQKLPTTLPASGDAVDSSDNWLSLAPANS